MRSDFSVFHRIDEIEALPARRFVALMLRLPYYDGAVAGRAREARQNPAPVPAGSPAPAAPPAAQRRSPGIAPPDPASDPLFGPLRAANQLVPVVEVGKG